MKKNRSAALDSRININDDLKRIVFVLLITNKGLSDVYKKRLMQEAKINYMILVDGTDLNYKPNIIFETQMYDSSQEIYLILCQNARVNQVMEIVEEQCRFLVEAQAQVISVPLTALINYNLFRFISIK